MMPIIKKNNSPEVYDLSEEEKKDKQFDIIWKSAWVAFMIYCFAKTISIIF